MNKKSDTEAAKPYFMIGGCDENERPQEKPQNQLEQMVLEASAAGLPTDEIASALGVKKSVAKTLLYRAHRFGLKPKGEKMSGGSYDYAYQRVNDFIEELEKNCKSDPLRIAFVSHLKDIAEAMHDIEWVDSGDYGEGREHAAIKRCLAAKHISDAAKHQLKLLSESIKKILEND